VIGARLDGTVSIDGTSYDGEFDPLVVALAPDGTVAWVRFFNTEASTEEARLHLEVDEDGDLYLVTRWDRGFELGGASLEAGTVLMKLDGEDGSTAWTTHVPGVDLSWDMELGPGVASEPALYVTGNVGPNADLGGGSLGSTEGNDDFAVASFDLRGAYRWAWSIGSAGFDRGISVGAAREGEVWVGGEYRDDIVTSQGTTFFHTGSGDNGFVFRLVR
jgi:hypothetical protein